MEDLYQLLFMYYQKLARFTSEIVPAKPKALAHFLLVKVCGVLLYNVVCRQLITVFEICWTKLCMNITAMCSSLHSAQHSCFNILDYICIESSMFLFRFTWPYYLYTQEMASLHSAGNWLKLDGLLQRVVKIKQYIFNISWNGLFVY